MHGDIFALGDVMVMMMIGLNDSHDHLNMQREGRCLVMLERRRFLSWESYGMLLRLVCYVKR